jgi:hypothetical protein
MESEHGYHELKISMTNSMTFRGSLEVPPRTSKDSEFPQIAQEASHATGAGPRNAWPHGITFLAVHWHCEIAELMSADVAHAARIPGCRTLATGARCVADYHDDAATKSYRAARESPGAGII